MTHIGSLPPGLEEAIIARLKGGQTPASIGGEIGFIRQAQHLQSIIFTQQIGIPRPNGPSPKTQITAPSPKPLGRPQQEVKPVGIRQSANAFQIGIPPISLPGGITVGGFQLPVPFPRGPSPVPRFPPPIPRVPPGGGRMPFPIPFPMPGIGGLDAGSACPRGFHLDKKTRSRCVRNRSMNALNPRALKRSLRRIDRFEDFVNKTASLTGLQLKKRSTRRKKSCR